MAHELEVTVKFKRKQFCIWWFTTHPRQCRPLIVVLNIRNKGSNAFSGANAGDLNFSTAQRFGLTHTVKFTSPIGRLDPNTQTVIKTKAFSTYHSGHCSIDTTLTATDGQPIEIWLKGPVSLEYEKEDRQNYFITACYVDSEELISQKWSSRLSFILSLVATGASLIALKISRDSTADANAQAIFQKETAKKVIENLDSLNGNSAKLISIPEKLDSIVAKIQNKSEKKTQPKTKGP